MGRTVQIFSYDEKQPLYQSILWNEEFWPKLLKYGNAQKNLGKYSFEYERIGEEILIQQQKGK